MPNVLPKKSGQVIIAQHSTLSGDCTGGLLQKHLTCESDFDFDVTRQHFQSCFAAGTLAPFKNPYKPKGGPEQDEGEVSAKSLEMLAGILPVFHLR